MWLFYSPFPQKGEDGYTGACWQWGHVTVAVAGGHKCVYRSKEGGRDARTEEAKRTECVALARQWHFINRFLSEVRLIPPTSVWTPALLDIIRATAVCKACCSPPICLLAVQIQELRPDDLQWLYLQTRLQPTATGTHSFMKRPRLMMVSAGSLSWDFP